jgi:ABC-2 type transport system permease protein
MRNSLIIIKHEIKTTLSKPAFWIMATLFPLFIVGINIFSQVISQQAIESAQAREAERIERGISISYVDEAGLIQSLPEDIPAGRLVAYPDREAAHAALAADEIDSYTIISRDYIQTGSITIVQADYNPLASTSEDIFQHIIAYNITGDATLTATIRDPLPELQSQSSAPPSPDSERRPESEALAFIVPFAVMFVFFMLIVMGGGYMLESVSREKENRTVEILLVSINPKQIMIGKIVGLSAIALLQMVIWSVGGILALGQADQFIEGASAFQFPPGFLIYALGFFLLGYLMYASLLGAIGALAPSAKESGSLTFIVMLPLLVPLWFNQALVQNPHGTIAMIFSMIPFTAPVSMLTRLVISDVPAWQILTSLAGLAVMTYLMVSLAARFFRADTLLSFDPIKKERVLAVFRK